MKLSIVIPTYNSSLFIEQTIFSIYQQLLKLNVSSEIIILDDFSEDNTFAKIKEIKKKFYNKKIRIREFYNSENLGQYKNTVKGLKKTKGDYIITLDDDFNFKNSIIINLYNHMIRRNFEIIFGIIKQKNFFDKIGRNMINKINKVDVLNISTSSIRIFNKNNKYKLINLSKKYNSFHLLTIDNFKNIGNINLKLNNLRTARKSNYNFFQKVLIFLFSTEKFINKILVITFSFITFFLFLIMIYGGYLLYNYFIIGFKGYPGWLSNVLLSLMTIALNLIILILIIKNILKRK